MYAVIMGTITVVLSRIIALLALSIGGYTPMLRILSYLHFCPARFYFNVTKAIEKLEALGEEGKEPRGEKYRFGTVKQGDTGFSGLITVLKEKAMLKGEVQEIRLIEQTAGLTEESDSWGASSHRVVRFLVLIRNNGKKETPSYNSSDPAQATRDLKDWTEEITRKGVAK
jgi:hypothetical protein